MAGTINGAIHVTFTSGNVSYTRAFTLTDVATVGHNYVANVQEIGTNEEALALGDVTAPGYAILHNLDDENFVEIRAGSAEEDVIKLEPGDVQLVRFATATPYAIANTAAVDLEYIIFEA